MKTQLRIASISLLALALLALAVTPSFANSITIYSTGQAATGQPDPYYQLLASSPTGAGPAYAIPPYLPGWVSPPAGTQWINPYPTGGAAPAGYYDYQTKFYLTGLDPSTAVLSGLWAADNAGYIVLNNSAAIGTGTSIPDPYGFKNLTPFTISAQTPGNTFNQGLNTLDFFVLNDYDVTGLLVDISGTASPAPEPSSLLLMGSGLIGLGGALRRKLKW